MQRTAVTKGSCGFRQDKGRTPPHTIVAVFSSFRNNAKFRMSGLASRFPKTSSRNRKHVRRSFSPTSVSMAMYALLAVVL